MFIEHTRYIDLSIILNSFLCVLLSVKSNVRKQVWRQNDKEENVGLMESLALCSIRGRDRDRENTHTQTILKNALTPCTCVCSMNTFYTSPRRTDRSTIVLQCSLRAPTLTPKIYSLWNIFTNDLPVLCTEPTFLCTGLRTGLRIRPNRSVRTDPVLGFFSRSGRCWACLSTH